MQYGSCHKYQNRISRVFVFCAIVADLSHGILPCLTHFVDYFCCAEKYGVLQTTIHVGFGLRCRLRWVWYEEAPARGQEAHHSACCQVTNPNTTFEHDTLFTTSHPTPRTPTLSLSLLLHPSHTHSLSLFIFYFTPHHPAHTSSLLS